MNPASPEPGRNWAVTAVAFYDESAGRINARRLNRVFINSYAPLADLFELDGKAAVLDVGCGPGWMAGLIGPRCGFLVGMDISTVSLERAREAYPASPFVCAQMERPPFRHNSFDFITAVSSLEHCYDKQGVLKRISALLKAGGQAYIEVRLYDYALLRAVRALPLPGLRARLLRAYPAEGFRDLLYGEWLALFEKSGFSIRKTFASRRPWRIGGLTERLKNLLILLSRFCLPIRRQYMAGFLLEKQGVIP